MLNLNTRFIYHSIIAIPTGKTNGFFFYPHSKSMIAIYWILGMKVVTSYFDNVIHNQGSYGGWYQMCMQGWIKVWTDLAPPPPLWQLMIMQIQPILGSY